MADTEPQLRFHIGGALNVGVAPKAIVETILHCLAFVGFPRTVNAMATAKRVFADNDLLPVAE